jgi:hypothetical protein
MVCIPSHFTAWYYITVPREDYALVPRHGSIRAMVNLADAYEFTATGSCRVAFIGTLQEVFPIGGNAPGEIYRNVIVSGEPATLIVRRR